MKVVRITRSWCSTAPGRWIGASVGRLGSCRLGGREALLSGRLAVTARNDRSTDRG